MLVLIRNFLMPNPSVQFKRSSGTEPRCHFCARDMDSSFAVQTKNPDCANNPKAFRGCRRCRSTNSISYCEILVSVSTDSVTSYAVFLTYGVCVCVCVLIFLGHPTCLDLTSEMIPIIKTYEWQCMECKACVKCMKPHDEVTAITDCAKDLKNYFIPVIDQ